PPPPSPSSPRRESSDLPRARRVGERADVRVSAAAGRHRTDAARRVLGQPPSMSSASYAVTWRNGDGSLHSGKAELRSHALRLEAVGGDVEDLRYEDLTGVSIARTASARIAGRQTLVLERRDASSLRLASISQLGIISELAERLAE